ncbi:MAG: ROK family protein [Verrucomicrobiales bacterium]
MQFNITHKPVLDPEFSPAVLWNRAYRKLADSTPGRREVSIALGREDGLNFLWKSALLPDSPEHRADNLKYVERVVKFLLWMKGGNQIIVGGAPEIAAALGKIYSEQGERAFDWDFIGKRIYGHPISVESVALSDVPAARDSAVSLGRHLDGNRIGFDLGGSDRKAAAVVNGEVVFSEEIKWDPYFQKDPEYHLAGIRDTLARAAAHLPGGKVDAIGGSAAGVYVNNQVRAASLFRGVPAEMFESHVRKMFVNLAREWGVPFVVVNDGEVTALAGSMSLGSNRVLGISMGTSLAAGYVNGAGQITPWLNELAFAPVDYRDNAPVDEWSRDTGCGVQYFSQQGVARLAKSAGYDFGKMPFAEQLEQVQADMKSGNENAARIYRTIGTCFGYSIAHYADFYEIEKLLILGRVTSGQGGQIIIEEANRVLADAFPELATVITITTPDEQMKRHGQAVAAASLPAI